MSKPERQETLRAPRESHVSLSAGAARPDFRSLFEADPEVVSSAPGRVNLIGEHTDYNGGYVLPVAIPQATRTELRKRAGTNVRVYSCDTATFDTFDIEHYELGSETRRGTWVDYVQGITHVLAKEGFLLSGFDLRIESTVPLGSGLSSSAALEVSLLRSLRKAFDLELDDVRLALLGQRAENDFVGAPVGMMDQMASSLADDHTALFLDTRTMAYERVPLPPSIELIVINSGIAHQHAAGDYRTRRAECERAAALLGVRELRDVQLSSLSAARSLPDVLSRRVRHVVSENDRVLRSTEALKTGDVDLLGRLFDESHKSMRDDYEVSIVEIDLLVEIARATPDVVGARLTGGGFGGSIVALARASSGRAASKRIADEYRARSGRAPTVLLPAP